MKPNFKNIQINEFAAQQAATMPESNWLTPELIPVKPYYSKDDLEGMEHLNDCVLGFNECSCTNPCAMHDDWIIIREKLNKVFRKKSKTKKLKTNNKVSNTYFFISKLEINKLSAIKNTKIKNHYQ